MKKIFSLVVLSTFVLLLNNSCKKDTTTPVTPSSTNTAIQAGTWKVTLFKEDSTDETYYFTDYVFTFNTDFTMSAVKTGSSQINGTWSTGNDDSQVKFVISFTPVGYFEKINNDWHVLSVSDTEIKLQDVSGGNGGVDYLTFTKI